VTDASLLAAGSSILQVNSYDIKGGAESVSMNLFLHYLDRGYRSFLIVGTKRGSDPRVREMDRGMSRNAWERVWLTKAGKLRQAKEQSAWARYRYYASRFLAHPLNTVHTACGGLDYDFPATGNLPDAISGRPDILHIHNIHGNYFDLRALPRLTKQVPVVMTLHDAILLGNGPGSPPAGRKNGHGFPAIPRRLAQYVRSADDLKIAEIFRHSAVYITAPSVWLMDQVPDSPLSPAVAGSRIIPHGVDLSLFHPYDRYRAREELGLPVDRTILLFISNGIRNNPDKDFSTLHTAVRRVAATDPKRKILFIAIGEDGPGERAGNLEVRFLPFIRDTGKLARYYQAADLLIHASRTEAWGLTVTEALACGIPVVATAVGGIPEQVRDGFNGILTPPEDPFAMAAGIRCLLDDDTGRERMGMHAAEDARARFDLEVQADQYLRYYRDVRSAWERRAFRN
jgi:glycosyltransferase involved in cell wall biosynthesis